MTSQSPRIYIYKITFEEVLYYYYGVHKEKKFGEYYMGSPVTHKWCWDFYTPKKQILQVFDFTDEGWLEAQEVENRLIKPFYNTDMWCLNEHCGSKISSYVSRKTGNKIKELKLGICGLSTEERREYSKRNYERYRKEDIGLFSISPEQIKEARRKANETHRKNKTGIYSITPEKRKEIGLFCKEKGIGIHSLTDDERKELGRKSGKYCKENGLGIFAETKEDRSKRTTQTNYQKWMCLETGFITNAGNLSRYQMKRGIDKSRRVRIE
jgi:hypothetical protein